MLGRKLDARVIISLLVFLHKFSREPSSVTPKISYSPNEIMRQVPNGDEEELWDVFVGSDGDEVTSAELVVRLMKVNDGYELVKEIESEEAESEIEILDTSDVEEVQGLNYVVIDAEKQIDKVGLESSQKEVDASQPSKIILESYESVGSESDPEKPWCFCKNERSVRMVGCDAQDCPIQWFHVDCVDFK
jgi:hypothetical protein